MAKSLFFAAASAAWSVLAMAGASLSQPDRRSLARVRCRILRGDAIHWAAWSCRAFNGRLAKLSCRFRFKGFSPWARQTYTVKAWALWGLWYGILISLHTGAPVRLL